MNKSWIDLPNRMSREYMDEINHFMEFTNGFDNELISCPCRKSVASMLPSGAKLAKSYYKARKLTENLGFTYEILDACPNNCMLFRNENAHLDMCIVCQTSRWKEGGVGYNRQNSSTTVINRGKRVVAKQLRAEVGLVNKMSVWMRSRDPCHPEVAAIFKSEITSRTKYLRFRKGTED
ncbi:hypothetical protein AAC387_Pa07g3660 [Persea americana]